MNNIDADNDGLEFLRKVWGAFEHMMGVGGGPGESSPVSVWPLVALLGLAALLWAVRRSDGPNLPPPGAVLACCFAVPLIAVSAEHLSFSMLVLVSVVLLAIFAIDMAGRGKELAQQNR